jgi:hypothetical protein
VTEEETQQHEQPSAPRFEHPKVLAVDLPEQAVDEIRAGDFNLAVGRITCQCR